jgi:hypothetical protein
MLLAPRNGFANDLSGAHYLIDAHEGVDFGQKSGKLFRESLGQTAGDDQGLAGAPGLSEFGGFEDRFDTFFLGGIDERAGIDDQSIGLRGVIGDFDAILQEGPEHNLGIDKVFGAPERDHADSHG